jgi:cytochrome c peroxidase
MAPKRRLRNVLIKLPWALALTLLGGTLFNFSALSRVRRPPSQPVKPVSLATRGQRIFRFDTFGDQKFWGGTLRLEKAIEGRKHGGVGPGVSPKEALALGLKVDVNALPGAIRSALAHGKVNLNDPAITLALLKLNAVVGLKGFFNRSGTQLTSIGITCAVCHSTVNNSFAPGIGQRLDGWPNRDLNVGAIVSASPHLQPVANVLGTDVATVKKVLASWGPGKFDAELFMDGKAFQPDGRSAATLIPPAFGLAGVNLHTYTGWGSIPYWNAFVANLEMHGQGDFTDARLDNANQFPVAARNGFGHVRHTPDLVTPALGSLQVYQLSLAAPKPPTGSFNAAAARRGQRIFNGQGKCASCHTPPLYTEGGWNLHTPASICTSPFQADRSPTLMYRTTPLRGLWTHTKGGFYHDGEFPTLLAVVKHYNSCMSLGLSPRQESDLVQFLKSL